MVVFGHGRLAEKMKNTGVSPLRCAMPRGSGRDDVHLF
jgi:hypothetical protein